MNDTQIIGSRKKPVSFKNLDLHKNSSANIDLTGSESERKSLCLRSIKINMKDSKINVELKAKDNYNNTNERMSFTSVVGVPNGNNVNLSNSLCNKS